MYYLFFASCYLVCCSYFSFATVAVVFDVVTAAAAAKLLNKSIDYSITESFAFYSKQRALIAHTLIQFVRLVNAKACQFMAICVFGNANICCATKSGRSMERELHICVCRYISARLWKNA